MKRSFYKVFVALLAVVALACAMIACGDEEKKEPATGLKWSVVYEAGEGTGIAPESGSYDVGETFTLPEATGLSREGYTFDKWNDDIADYDAGATYTMPMRDVIFTATWKADGNQGGGSSSSGSGEEDPGNTPAPTQKYVAAFDLGGGTGTAPAIASYEAGETFALPEATGFTKAGYTFSK